jgi:CysZ protein
MSQFNVNSQGVTAPVLAVNCFLKGLKLLSHAGLRPFIILPVLINLLMYSIVLWLGYYYVNDLINQFIPGWLSWLSWILIPLFFISFFIVGFFTFTLLANLIAAPFYSKLSAKTLALMTGQAAQVKEQPIMTVLWGELRRILYLGSRALPLLLLFIIPGVNIIAAFLWGVFGAWGLALEYMAYPLENEGLLFKEQLDKIKVNRMGTLSFGGLAMLGLTLPVLNILVPPATVIGATIYRQALSQKP